MEARLSYCSLFAVRRSLFRTASTHTHTHAYPSLPAPLGLRVGRPIKGPRRTPHLGVTALAAQGAAAGEGVCVALAESFQSARLAILNIPNTLVTLRSRVSYSKPPRGPSA